MSPVSPCARRVAAAFYGPPGVGKTTLGYSAPEPLLLDFDAGAHRAVNRRDTLMIDAWSDVAEIMADPSILGPYQTIVVDTVGRCLDVMTADILDSTPKLGRDGTLTQQGWGALKTRFRTWMAQLRGLQKHVVLLAHEREDKDGDSRLVRPDIVGGSYAEVLKIADFVGYLYVSGRQRLLDFTPTDRSVGKSPGGWKPLAVPPVDQSDDVLERLLHMGREALGLVSARHRHALEAVGAWKTAIAQYATPEDFGSALESLAQLSPVVRAQVRKLLWARAQELGLEFDRQSKTFRVPVPASAPAPAEPVVTADDLRWGE